MLKTTPEIMHLPLDRTSWKKARFVLNFMKAVKIQLTNKRPKVFVAEIMRKHIGESILISNYERVPFIAPGADICFLVMAMIYNSIGLVDELGITR